jgi:hypothetical protein
VVTEDPVTSGCSDEDIERAYLSCLSMAEAQKVPVKRAADQFVATKPVTKLRATKTDIRRAEGRLLERKKIEVRDGSIHHPPQAAKSAKPDPAANAQGSMWPDAQTAKSNGSGMDFNAAGRRSQQQESGPTDTDEVVSPAVAPDEPDITGVM